MSYADPEKQREYQRQWKARRRAEWFADKECVDCGTTEQLQLDHVDATQKVSHKIWSWSQVRRETELVKCVVRCRPCHQAKTNRCQEWEHRLTVEQVAEIRQRYEAGDVLQRDLALEFVVSEATVWDIINHRTWVQY